MRSTQALSQLLPDPARRIRPRQRGSALVEISLLAPWILFLFVGMFDMGMYTYSMIGVENAVRVAAGNQLIPIPGLLMGKLNITRTLQVRVKP